MNCLRNSSLDSGFMSNSVNNLSNITGIFKGSNLKSISTSSTDAVFIRPSGYINRALS
jgi:hypothetical protein